MTWRDKASPQAQDDLDRLLELALGFARQQLAEHGEFYPYAVVVNDSGEHEMFAADLPNDQTESEDAITALIDAASTRRHELRAVAIVADTRLPELNSDTVRVILEHRDGTVMAVLLPYYRRRLGGLVFADLRATEAGAYVW